MCLPADSLPTTKVKGLGLIAGGEARTFLALARNALSDTRVVEAMNGIRVVDAMRTDVLCVSERRK